MAEALRAMWLSRALKATIHRPPLNSGQAKLCLLVSSKHLWCPKNILEETGLQGNKPIRAPRAFLCPRSPSLSLRDTSLSFIFPRAGQSVLPLWLVLYLCWCLVPAFKGNNYCCILPFEQTLWKKLCEIKLCLSGLIVCCSELHIMGLSKFDLPLLIIDMNVWQSKDMTMIKKNNWKLFKL